MDEYTTEEMKYKNGYNDGRRKGIMEGYEAGFKAASARNRPESPYDGDNVLSCPHCGSGEYLHNHDGNKNKFCGRCGQAIDWTEKEV